MKPRIWSEHQDGTWRMSIGGRTYATVRLLPGSEYAEHTVYVTFADASKSEWVCFGLDKAKDRAAQLFDEMVEHYETEYTAIGGM